MSNSIKFYIRLLIQNKEDNDLKLIILMMLLICFIGNAIIIIIMIITKYVEVKDRMKAILLIFLVPIFSTFIIIYLKYRKQKVAVKQNFKNTLRADEDFNFDKKNKEYFSEVDMIRIQKKLSNKTLSYSENNKFSFKDSVLNQIEKSCQITAYEKEAKLKDQIIISEI